MSNESKMGQAILGLAIGVVGIACTGAFSPAVAGTAIAGAAIGNVGEGFVSTIAIDGLKSGYQAVVAWLKKSANEPLPKNHDLARAIRKSHLNALQFLLNGIRTAALQNPSTYDIRGTEAFCNAADIWVADQLKAADHRDFMLGVPLEDAIFKLDEIIEQNENARAAKALSDLTADVAFAEFSKSVKVDVPDSFSDWFYGRAPESVGWIDVAHAFFAERLKTDSRLSTAIFLDFLKRSVGGIAGLSTQLDEALTAISKKGGVLSNRFDRLDEAIQILIERKVEIDQGSLRDALFSILARKDFEQALANRIAVEAPADSWAASRAVVDVRARIASLSTAFFGREAESATLDAFIEDHENGLVVIAAPAGGGKSVFLAHWLDRRRAEGDVVVRHFVSGLYPGTTETIDTLRHLSSQLREVDALYSVGSIERIPDEPAVLLDALTARLSSQPSENERLIVILDGLDELKSPLSDVFVRATLGKGVFVVVSGRSAPDETPLYLKQWEEIELGDIPFLRFDIPGLSVPDVSIWLEGIISHLDVPEMALLTDSVWKATDGLPLFLRYVIEEMTNWLPRVRSFEELLARVAVTPSSFSEFVTKELAHFRDEMGANLTESVSTLFALLTRTLGPITDSEIEAVFSFSRIADAGFPPCPVLTGIDHRVGRWLSIRVDAGARHFAFAHPRLAVAFAKALGKKAECTEDYLISWMENAWQSKETRRGIKAGADYALDWLPEHLSTFNKHQAARLLSSPTFLHERLRDPCHASRRLGATLDHWMGIGQDVKDVVPGSRRWTAFWAENETILRRATASAAAAGLDTAAPVLRCLGDAATSGSEPKPPTSASMISYPPQESGLLRSIGDAHASGVVGVMLVGVRLVSWGEDGAIRCWSLDGAALAGGASDAHASGVNGILPVGDRLVSWGGDGAIRFWSLNGAALAGGPADAHTGGVNGILPIDDRLISWGGDGAIRFWSFDGAALSGGALDAHFRRVSGLLMVDDHLVSWGNDGAIRCWSLDGAPLAGGAANAHVNGVFGILFVDDRLVSWGEDGAIRFWSLDGFPLVGGAINAHSDRDSIVMRFDDHGNGVLLVGERLVSWGRDGAIRFWSRNGTSLAGGALDAHSGGVHGVLPVGDCLISWGGEGTIRCWSLDGDSLSRVVLDAHFNEVYGVLLVNDRLVTWGKYGDIRLWTLNWAPFTGGSNYVGHYYVKDVLQIDDRLVSWGLDGAIRFWSHNGAPLTGGSARAHPGFLGVSKVLLARDRLVSWGFDGVIRFWSVNGTLLASGALDVHSGKRVYGVLLVNECLVSWGGDNAIRFWSLDGTPLVGGVACAHSSGLNGVLWTGSRLVSWGVDGAIRFWSLDGSPLAGGALDAHSSEVRVVQQVSDRLVSYSEDGVIRFWSLDGDLLAADVADYLCHFLPIGDRLVSWGFDGAIRFWSHNGVSLVGGAANAHSSMVRGVLLVGDRLISWGKDGAIRYWSDDGAPLVGGAANAHSSGVDGVLLTGDRLVSWGGRAIRFWSHDGAPLVGGAANAHSSGVGGVLLAGDRLVSWGSDGAIRYWSYDGIPVDILAVPGGLSSVYLKSDRLIVFGRALWIYKV
jgi:WD40 repeat protein